MTLGTSYAAETSERLSIYAGLTCGFAAEIAVGLTERSFGKLLTTGEDRAARAVVFGLLARDAL